MISRQKTIQVELTEEHIKNVDVLDSAKYKELFKIEPAIEGKVVWVGERTVEFQPLKPLEANQFYDVYFDLDLVSTVKSDYQTFHFQFATYSQKIFVEENGLNDYYYEGLDYKYLQGKISTTDFEDTAQLKKVIVATQDGKELPLTFSEDYEENTWNYTVDSIQRKDVSSEVIIKWDGKPIKSFSSGKLKVDVPKKGDYYLLSAKVYEEEDQWIELNFSEPIASEQDLTGLIELEGENTTFSIEENTVKLFLKNRITGIRKVKIHSGISNISGHRLLNSSEENLFFEAPKPNIRIKGKGNILPNSQGLIFPFESIGLKSVEVRIVRIFEHNVHHFLQVNDLDGNDELTRFGKIIKTKTIFLNKEPGYNSKIWMHHVLNLNELIKPQIGAIYRVSIKFNKKDSDCGCEITEEETTTTEKKDSWNEDYWRSWGDFDDGFDSWYYYYDNESSACSDDYYQGKAKSRNILASDLGLIFKLDDNKKGHVFVNNMLSTEPVKGAQVEFYTYSKDLITAGQTDENGMLEVKLYEKPFLMVAKNGSQRGYLKLRDGKVNALNRFDVDGEVNESGVRGYIYGERGVWRPGDSLYLCFMLGDRLNKLPKNHPVQFDVQDPFGQTIYTSTKTKNVNGIYDFRMATDPQAITGNYTAIATVGNQTFTKTLKIETIKPNRLKIEFKTASNGSSDSSNYLKARWLHGAIAKNLEATITVAMFPTTTTFKAYKDYVFDSPLRAFRSDVETIFEGKLNEKGEARPKTKIQLDRGAPGKLQANYIVKVFEESGDFSIDRFQEIYSPYQTYVGLKTPSLKDYDESLMTNKNHRFDVVTVDASGNPVNMEKVRVRVYKIKWRSWYEKSDEDLYSYVSRSGTIAVKDTLLSTKNGKSNFYFRVNYPEYGRYLVTVTDEKGEHQTGKILNVDWPYWERGNRSENEEAKMMNFSTDKTAYVKGEKIQMRFPSPQSGRALVSIENSRKVLKKFWVKTQAGETTCDFIASEEMAPSCYVHVTMIQPHASTKNDSPIRMYGVVPIRVDDPTTHIDPVINAPEVIKPESTASIKVREKSGRKMSYTLAIVDDGLLDLTRFATPQPWPTFYPKEALGVKTWDMYDDVIGAYAGRLDNLLTIGGDGDWGNGAGPKANRFKPMVRFIGPFTLEAGQEKTHKIDVPNYIGSVRIMVVAHNNDGAYGNAEKTVFVRKPLMLLTTLPRVLGPGEEISLPVNVFAMENHVRKVNVSLETNDYFEVIGKKTEYVEFVENGDKIVYFRVKIKQKIGVGTFKIKAISGKETAYEALEVDIRPSNPKIVESTVHTLESGGKLKLPFELLGMSGTNKITVEVSTMPSIALEKRLNYLIAYPHGCLEQTTSSVFPQLYLNALMELTEKQKTETNYNIQRAIERLQQFQTASGGFAYWPGESNENEWGTSYAGHFLIEAQNAGFKLPASMKERWIAYQQEKAKNWSSGAFYGRLESDEHNQAYRLYTLSLAGKAELGAMNRLRETSNLTKSAKWRLAAAYALAGQKPTALKLIQNVSTDVSSYRELSGTFGSAFRDKAMILETLELLGQSKKADEILYSLAETMRSDTWLSTQETAYGLLAICTLTGKEPLAKSSYSYRLENDDWQNASFTKTLSKLEFKGTPLSKNKLVEIANKGGKRLYVTLTSEGIPMEGKKKAKSNGLAMNVRYVDQDGNSLKLEKITQGMEFKVETTLKNLSKTQTYKELSLSQVFPSGWEISNARMDGQNDESSVRYQDFRDDRVYSYLDLSPGQTKTVTIRCIAAYNGKYFMPATFASAMYNEQIMAYLPGKWCEVRKEKN
jgi:uncharacterized protein YfaS (alpha-2-macroglobulin family)